MNKLHSPEGWKGFTFVLSEFFENLLLQTDSDSISLSDIPAKGFSVNIERYKPRRFFNIFQVPSISFTMSNGTDYFEINTSGRFILSCQMICKNGNDIYVRDNKYSLIRDVSLDEFIKGIEAFLSEKEISFEWDTIFKEVMYEIVKRYILNNKTVSFINDFVGFIGYGMADENVSGVLKLAMFKDTLFGLQFEGSSRAQHLYLEGLGWNFKSEITIRKAPSPEDLSFTLEHLRMRFKEDVIIGSNISISDLLDRLPLNSGFGFALAIAEVIYLIATDFCEDEYLQDFVIHAFGIETKRYHTKEEEIHNFFFIN